VKIIGLELIVLKFYQVKIQILFNLKNHFFLFLLAPATVNHLPISTKNLTQTPFTTDLSAYFDWLNKTYGISKAPNSTQLITKSPISHKNSKDKIQKNQFNF